VLLFLTIDFDLLTVLRLPDLRMMNVGVVGGERAWMLKAVYLKSLY
jgi:hypothetical protein